MENNHSESPPRMSVSHVEKRQTTADPRSKRKNEHVTRNFDLSGLSFEQRNSAREMLLEESESFSCDDDDIGLSLTFSYINVSYCMYERKMKRYAFV